MGNERRPVARPERSRCPAGVAPRGMRTGWVADERHFSSARGARATPIRSSHARARSRAAPPPIACSAHLDGPGSPVRACAAFVQAIVTGTRRRQGRPGSGTPPLRRRVQHPRSSSCTPPDTSGTRLAAGTGSSGTTRSRPDPHRVRRRPRSRQRRRCMAPSPTRRAARRCRKDPAAASAASSARRRVRSLLRRCRPASRRPGLR
jgi:hypothetical protein